MQVVDDPTRTFEVYGLTLASPFDLSPFLPVAEGTTSTDVSFACSTEPPADLRLGPGRLVFDRDTITISRHDSWDVVSFGESTTHYIGGDAITCHLRKPDHAFLVPIQLLGMVLAVWLEAHGRLVLHASGVDIGGDGVAFLAGPEAGKTSLAAAFTGMGDALVTEDLAAVSTDAGFALASGYPMVRMWPETVRHFTGETEGFDIYHPAFDKVWVPAGRLGRFANGSVPLRRIYVPRRVSEGGISVGEVAYLDAVKAILSGSFLADMIEPASDVARRFQRVGDLVSAVPVRTLTFPPGLERLSDVRAAVLDDLSD